LSSVVQTYLNKPQDFSQLQEAAVAVAAVYREAGWLVRTFLPQQDLTDGVLTIQIVEAVFSGIGLEGADSERVKFDQVADIFEKQQALGQAANANALDRALLLADDLPGVVVSGNLVAGVNEGETGIDIRLKSEPLVVGEVSIDNTGSRSTGSERLGASLYVNSPLGKGDLTAVNLSHSSGSDYLRVSVTAPLGSDGWRAGGSASSLRYKIVSPEFAALQSQGESGSFGLEASYPLVRARKRNLYLNLNFEHKTFHNESNATVQSDYVSRNTSIGLTGNLYDDLGGANSASISLVAGTLSLGSLQPAENAAREGGFNKFRFALSRQQALTSELSLFGALSGQQASQPLDSSEKFMLGGATGVRAYPSSEGSGSAGQVANIELRWRLPQGFSLAGFYDWGSVRNFDNSPNYSLKGLGMSLVWQTPMGGIIKAIWSRRMGDNPNPTATGMDQDGSLDMNRWWLTASMPF
jgi:hemolysin activation/secretion protein